MPPLGKWPTQESVPPSGETWDVPTCQKVAIRRTSTKVPFPVGYDPSAWTLMRNMDFDAQPKTTNAGRSCQDLAHNADVRMPDALDHADHEMHS